jgi:O-methyltransferase
MVLTRFREFQRRAQTKTSTQSDAETLLNKIGYPANNVKFHVGWFQNTVPESAKSIGKIAILRIDGDLYESYRVALDHLWDHVVPGGFVIFDDWVYKGCRDAVSEFFRERSIKSYISYSDATVRYIQKS